MRLVTFGAEQYRDAAGAKHLDVPVGGWVRRLCGVQER
jgi:hypothetical protein